MTRPVGPITDSFWTKDDRFGRDGCWLWTAFIDKARYMHETGLVAWDAAGRAALVGQW